MNSAAPSLSQQYLRSRMGKVCVAIIGSTATEMVDRATEAMRDSPFLEFRLDYLEKPLAALPKLKQFLADNSVVTAIATCRRAANGGKFKGTIAAELEVLTESHHLGLSPGGSGVADGGGHPGDRTWRSCAPAARPSSSPGTIFRRPRIWTASSSASGRTSRSSSRS